MEHHMQFALLTDNGTFNHIVVLVCFNMFSITVALLC